MKKAEEFAKVYQEYYLKVYSYLSHKIPNRQDAEDLAQEVFVACYQKFDSYDKNRAAVGTWIYVIMKNKLKNYYRDHKQMESLDDENQPVILVDQQILEEAVLLEEQNRMLFQAIRKLSKREQTILNGKYYQKKSSQELADMLSMTPGNVRVVLNRALKKLNKELRNCM